MMYYDQCGRQLTLNLLPMEMIEIIYKQVRQAKVKKDGVQDLVVPLLSNRKIFRPIYTPLLNIAKAKIPVKLAWALRETITAPPPGPRKRGYLSLLNMEALITS